MNMKLDEQMNYYSIYNLRVHSLLMDTRHRFFGEIPLISFTLWAILCVADGRSLLLMEPGGAGEEEEPAAGAEEEEEQPAAGAEEEEEQPAAGAEEEEQPAAGADEEEEQPA